jgi:spore maturation protein CgeB
LTKRGHDVHFFERDVPYYASHRDLTELPGGRLHLYPDWETVVPLAARESRDADVTMITSYCPDALAAADLCLSCKALHTFYDLDTGVTLKRLEDGLPVGYVGPRGFRDYDLVLSYIGGRALDKLYTRLGARACVPLYGSVDPDAHFPVAPRERFRADLSYLGTFSEDRQPALEELFIQPAHRLPHQTFRIGGAMYPAEFPWAPNICFDRHLPPADHPAFFCSSRITLNVTRPAMAENGYCPSGRFFEAAACGVPVLSDRWEGLDAFFSPGSEVLEARDAGDVVNALSLSDAELKRIGSAARDRALAQHTAAVRACELEIALEAAISSPVLSGAEA